MMSAKMRASAAESSQGFSGSGLVPSYVRCSTFGGRLGRGWSSVRGVITFSARGLAVGP